MGSTELQPEAFGVTPSFRVMTGQLGPQQQCGRAWDLNLGWSCARLAGLNRTPGPWLWQQHFPSHGWAPPRPSWLEHPSWKHIPLRPRRGVLGPTSRAAPEDPGITDRPQAPNREPIAWSCLCSQSSLWLLPALYLQCLRFPGSSGLNPHLIP